MESHRSSRFFVRLRSGLARPDLNPRCALCAPPAPGFRRYARVGTGIGGKQNISRRIQFLGYGACALAGCLWGTGFYFGRLAMNEMSVEYMVLYRFFFACAGDVAGVIPESRSGSRAERSGCC